VKRGGGLAAVPIDTEGAERDLAASAPDPAEAFEREWAVATLARAVERLREEYTSGKRRGQPEVILSFFGFDAPPSYAEAAARSGMTPARFKACLHRARTRFRELLREEVAPTASEGALEDEIADLLRILRR
jgi:hypothetical protein